MKTDNINEISNSKALSLTPTQLAAVEHIEGPLLVLAGAGTGKTRVLTSRIAHLIEGGHAFASQILAITFTNKAAREMKERVETLLGDRSEGINMGTFHAIAVKILRMHAESVGRSRDFTIVAYDEQLKIQKQILKKHDIDEAKAPAKLLHYLIDSFKNKAYLPAQVPHSMDSDFGGVSLLQLYKEYQDELTALNAMDFGDLLLYNIEIFNNHSDILGQYQRRFKYILVDEYQDTNVAQYIWLRLLAQAHNNICCVGDDDQSIYGWRGAQVSNILRFDKDFEGVKVVRLEQNYRSTQKIIKAASHIISHNESRHQKEIFSKNDEGENIKLNNLYDDKEEARFVVDEIDALVKFKQNRYSDIAILVRAGYQTRSFEESLNFLQIPYTVVGGLKFYERAEIRDVISYIRFLMNPEDILAFERLVNVPRRGIGAASMQTLINESRALDLPFLQAAREVISSGKIRGKAAVALERLFGQFEMWRQHLAEHHHTKVVDKILHESDYLSIYKNEDSDIARDKIDNIKELLQSLNEFNDLREYLEHISLVTDTDSAGFEDRVSIMTMHAAKGLEFSTVFLPGWEEGVFPSQKTIDEGSAEGLEEERRLAYVAITRAKQRLFISFASRRRVFGHYQSCFPSRFIDELPKETYEIVNNYNLYSNKGGQGNGGGFSPKSNHAVDFRGSGYGGQRYGSFASQNQRSMEEKLDYPVVDEESSPIKVVKKKTYAGNAKAGFSCGDRVYHEKFGAGLLISEKGGQAVVSFEKYGLKKIMSDYIKPLKD